MKKTMKYIKKIKFALSLLPVAGIGLTSCTDWLNIPPPDQMLENEVFATESGITRNLNGLYLNMANNGLYGQNLTSFTTELMGQRYPFSAIGAETVSQNANVIILSQVANLSFYNNDVRDHFNGIFRDAYVLIRNINNFIAKLEATDGVVTAQRKDLLLGEAYALRAFLHLDMLRIFGHPPVLDSTGRGIPYRTQPTREWTDILEVGEVLGLIVDDIEVALAKLEDDPVLTLGIEMDMDNSESSFFYNAYRNRRLNYYAVKALKMRAYMYAGTEEGTAVAGRIAKELIEDEGFRKAFPWSFNNSILSDPICSDEVIFGIHVYNLYDEFIRWFSPANTRPFSALPTSNGLHRYMFRRVGSTTEIDNYDRRLAQWLPYNETDWITAKFRRPAPEASYLYYQPLIRKSEVYLTAAEVFQDPTYLDEIRINRGKLRLSEEGASYNLQDEILREWMRDFVSEGQLFYYYKRRAQTSIINYNGAVRTTATYDYMPPLPDTETER